MTKAIYDAYYAPSEKEENLWALGHSGSTSSMIEAAEETSNSKLLEAMASFTGDISVLRVIAGNPALNEETARKLLSASESYFLWHLVRNRAMPQNFLEEILKTHETLAVLSQGAFAPDTLWRIYHKDERNREAVLRNALCPGELLEKAYREHNTILFVAAHANLPLHLFEEIFESAQNLRRYEAHIIMKRLLLNVSTPPALLRKMREYLRQNPLNFNKDERDRILAFNPNTPLDVLLRIAVVAKYTVALNAIQHDSFTAGVFEWLSLHKKWQYRSVAAMNPNLTPAQEERLADDRSARVRNRLAKNPALGGHRTLLYAMGDASPYVRNSAAQRLEEAS